MSTVTLFDYVLWAETDLSNWTVGLGSDSWDVNTDYICSTGTLSAHNSAGLGYISAADAAQAANTELYREIDVSSLATEIDGGSCTVDASSYIGSYTGDTGHVAVEFYDGGDVIIGSRTSGTGIDPGCTWTQDALSAVAVPALTRKIRLILVATYGAGSYNNAYFDSMELSLTGPGIAPGDSEVTNLAADAMVLMDQEQDTEVTHLKADALVLFEAAETTEVTNLVLEAVVLWDPDEQGVRTPQHLPVVNLTW